MNGRLHKGTYLLATLDNPDYEVSYLQWLWSFADSLDMATKQRRVKQGSIGHADIMAFNSRPGPSPNEFVRQDLCRPLDRW
jgi:hypothetical protein